MIGVVLKGHDYKYEVSELIKLFTSDFRFIDERDCMMVIENSIFYHGDKVFSKTVFHFYYKELTLIISFVLIIRVEFMNYILVIYFQLQ